MTGAALQDLLEALSGADQAVARLEGRLSGSPLARGWTRRMAVNEAIAWSWNTGGLAGAAALLLHDAEMDVDAPAAAVVAAHAVLRRRRRRLTDPDQPLDTWPEVAALLGRRSGRTQSPDRPFAPLPSSSTAASTPWCETGEAPSPTLTFLNALQLPRDLKEEDDDALFDVWTAAGPHLERWPALIGAAALLDRWEQLEPLPRQSDVGALLVEARLRKLRALHHAQLLVECGKRSLGRSGQRLRPAATPIERTGYWLRAIAAGARAGLAELDRLSIASQVLTLHLKGRRSSSRLPELIQLLLAEPLVTAPQAAQVLKVTPQAVRVMIGLLGSSVRELTGRQRFRAWSV